MIFMRYNIRFILRTSEIIQNHYVDNLKRNRQISKNKNNILYVNIEKKILYAHVTNFN